MYYVKRRMIFLCLEIDKNDLINTITSYTGDLILFGDFLKQNDRSLNLDEITSSSLHIFFHKIINHSCYQATKVTAMDFIFKIVSQFCLKTNYMKSDFTATTA